MNLLVLLIPVGMYLGWLTAGKYSLVAAKRKQLDSSESAKMKHFWSSVWCLTGGVLTGTATAFGTWVVALALVLTIVSAPLAITLDQFISEKLDMDDPD